MRTTQMAQTINIYTNHMYGIKYQGAAVTVCVCVEGDGIIIIIYYTEHYYNSNVGNFFSTILLYIIMELRYWR